MLGGYRILGKGVYKYRPLKEVPRRVIICLLFYGYSCSSVSGQNEPLPTVSHEKNLPKSQIINPLLTKLFRLRWLDIGLIFFASLWTETESRSIKTQKKGQGQYPAMLTSRLVNNPYILTSRLVNNPYMICPSMVYKSEQVLYSTLVLFSLEPSCLASMAM